MAGPTEWWNDTFASRTAPTTRSGTPASIRASNSARLGLDDDGPGDLADQGFLGLQAVAGDAEDGRAVAVDPALCDQLLATATVTPPAVSAKIPSVSARSCMPSTIASSSTSSLQPPVSRISCEAK